MIIPSNKEVHKKRIQENNTLIFGNVINQLTVPVNHFIIQPLSRMKTLESIWLKINAPSSTLSSTSTNTECRMFFKLGNLGKKEREINS
jgi:hypothetical protein